MNNEVVITCALTGSGSSAFKIALAPINIETTAARRWPQTCATHTPDVTHAISNLTKRKP